MMSRNNQSYFASQPDVNISRSRFSIPFSHKTTMNAGKLVPFYLAEVLPGDSLTMDTTTLVRMSTPIFPVMDNAYIDTYYFYVPNRIVWNHWKELNGENNNTPWTENVEYNVPYTTAPQGGWDKGSIADYMGIPTNVDGFEVNSLPFRGYVQIWNEFFRDQNYMRPAVYSVDDNTQQGHNTEYAPTAVLNSPEDPRFYSLYSAIGGGMCLPVSKFHDYFTSCTPQAQKGDPVTIPVFEKDLIPVGAFAAKHTSGVTKMVLGVQGAAAGNNVLGAVGGGAVSALNWSGSGLGTTAAPVLSNGGGPANLYVDLSTVNLGTISDLRQAYAIQTLLETDGRYGTRYTSILYGHFGVQSPDARLQRPEYLGGARVPINIDQVLQTSATNDVSPQGNTAAFSLTVNTDNSFTKSFVEHGFVIGVCCIRTDHTYQQGINKLWSRRRRYDYYWPELANISAQPILRKEIYATDDPEYNEEVFGYQEPWADYRYMPNRVSGAFRSGYGGTLDNWHYADYFTGADEGSFIANGAFMCETAANIDRTLAVQSSVEDQFLCDFYCQAIFTRPMPIYSIPGLTGHM